MSEADAKKQETERSIFLSACEYCKSNSTHIRTRNIMNYLNGEFIDREKNDKPDLINRCINKNKECIVGIEMFYVDQNSKKSRGRFKSNSYESQSALKETYNLGHKELFETGNVSEEYCESILKEGFKLAQDGMSSQYSMLISAFKYHFEHHANRAKLYRDNIEKLSNGKEIELVFYIEIEGHFHHLFLNKDNTVIRYDSKISPFFSDFVSIINRNENKRYIDYFVFDFKAKHPIERKIIAVRSGNLRANLKNQGITIYEYAGENTIITNQTQNNYERKENGDYTVSFIIKDIDNNGDNLQKAYDRALVYKKNNIPFVASRRVQAGLYASKANNYEEMIALEKEFIDKYPI